MANQQKSGSKMTVTEAGRKGGGTVVREQGSEFYQEIGKKGGETVAREKGPDFYRKIGEKGGKARAENDEN